MTIKLMLFYFPFAKVLHLLEQLHKPDFDIHQANNYKEAANLFFVRFTYSLKNNSALNDLDP